MLPGCSQGGAVRYGGALAGLPDRGAAPRETNLTGHACGRAYARVAQPRLGCQACGLAIAREPFATAGPQFALDTKTEDASSNGVHAWPPAARGQELPC